jgi:hypothetical protein
VAERSVLGRAIISSETELGAVEWTALSPHGMTPRLRGPIRQDLAEMELVNLVDLLTLDHACRSGMRLEFQMAFAVSSDAGIGGKLTVRVPTPEEAVARAQLLLNSGSDQVRITVTATGEEFGLAEFASRMRTNTLPKPDTGRSLC